MEDTSRIPNRKKIEEIRAELEIFKCRFGGLKK
jgi:hypothetical protein